MPSKRRIQSLEAALAAWRESVGDADEVALVANPAYVAGSCELYPLARRNPGPLDAVDGIVMDMDGTTTTTEPICLHSLEWMVRQVTGRPTAADWAGLDAVRDHPHVIGNSTTRHVEYLLQTYGDRIVPAAFQTAYVGAVLWTLANSQDAERVREVTGNAAALGLRDLLEEAAFQRLVRDRTDPFGEAPPDAQAAVQRAAPAVRLETFTDRVRAAVDIYYVRYHTILAMIQAGRQQELRGQIAGTDPDTLIAPMPLAGVFLATAKGWLGQAAERFHEPLAAHVQTMTGTAPTHDAATLAAIGRWFEAHPARIAVVTSSVRYEADIVLTEVFRALEAEARTWPLAPPQRERIARGFARYAAFYDAVVTASDSSEIRLKPHRDLYAIALHRMGIPRERYDHVVGFEDSESGVIAIRAAGVGCSVALPFAQSASHDFGAAVHVLPGQFPEVLLNHRAFLSPQALHTVSG